MKFELYETGKWDTVVFDTENLNKQDIENLKVGVRNKTFNRGEAVRLIENSNLSNNQKSDIESSFGWFTGPHGLRESLYNILKIVNENKRGFFGRDKVASIKELEKRCLIVSEKMAFKVENEFATTERYFWVYRLTALGQKNLETMVRIGEQHINQTLNRIKDLGYAK